MNKLILTLDNYQEDKGRMVCWISGIYLELEFNYVPVPRLVVIEYETEFSWSSQKLNG